MSPAVRPMTNAGRPLTGFARPGTSSRTGVAPLPLLCLLACVCGCALVYEGGVTRGEMGGCEYECLGMGTRKCACHCKSVHVSVTAWLLLRAQCQSTCLCLLHAGQILVLISACWVRVGPIKLHDVVMDDGWLLGVGQLCASRAKAARAIGSDEQVSTADRESRQSLTVHVLLSKWHT